MLGKGIRGKKGESMEKKIKRRKLTPIRALRLYCLKCCNGNADEVKNCPVKKCAAWPYRMGKRPTEDILHGSDISYEKKAS